MIRWNNIAADVTAYAFTIITRKICSVTSVCLSVSNVAQKVMNGLQ